MKQTAIKLPLMVLALGISQLTNAVGCYAGLGSFGSNTIFVARSQSVNAARDLVCWQRDINKFDAGDYYWSTNVTLEYDRTFQDSRIAEYLFGGSSLKFTGSSVATRDAQTDILADYFGLPGDYESTVCFSPRISSTIVDFASYVGLDRVWKGLYIRWHTPLVHTKWDLRMQENVINSGLAYQQSNNPAAGFYPAGYMGDSRVTRTELAPNAIQAWSNPVAYGDMQSPMKYGKVSSDCIRKDMFGDTELAVGWNFLQDEWYHAGINLRATLPISDRFGADYIFQPQIGNGHHTGIGFGWTSHVDVWESNDAQRRIAVYLDTNFMHLLSTNHMRSYDLKHNGSGSRYMLLEEYVPGANPAIFYTANQTSQTLKYNENLVPAINVTTLCSWIHIDVEADLAFKVAYYNCGTQIDMGYSLWARTREKLTCREKMVASKYGIKGDAQVYGFALIGDDPSAALALGSTESMATVHGGPDGISNVIPVATQKDLGVSSDVPYRNKTTSIDNASFNIVTSNADVLKNLNLLDASIFGSANIKASLPPVLLTDADIDELSALAPRFISHKFFGSIDHRWEDTVAVTPFAGLGMQIEVAHTCEMTNAGFAQWGFWVKGGFSY